jgi:hypothetical protein
MFFVRFLFLFDLDITAWMSRASSTPATVIAAESTYVSDARPIANTVGLRASGNLTSRRIIGKSGKLSRPSDRALRHVRNGVTSNAIVIRFKSYDNC